LQLSNAIHVFDGVSIDDFSVDLLIIHCVILPFCGVLCLEHIPTQRHTHIKKKTTRVNETSAVDKAERKEERRAATCTYLDDLITTDINSTQDTNSTHSIQGISKNGISITKYTPVDSSCNKTGRNERWTTSS
jgi:hypothetical protein